MRLLNTILVVQTLSTWCVHVELLNLVKVVCIFVLLQVRASADLEMQQVVNEVRRQVEKEKEIAIAETKRKKWVRHSNVLSIHVHVFP